MSRKRCLLMVDGDVCWVRDFFVCEVEGSSAVLGEDINPMTGLVYLPTI